MGTKDIFRLYPVPLKSLKASRRVIFRIIYFPERSPRLFFFLQLGGAWNYGDDQNPTSLRWMIKKEIMDLKVEKKLQSAKSPFEGILETCGNYRLSLAVARERIKMISERMLVVMWFRNLRNQCKLCQSQQISISLHVCVIFIPYIQINIWAITKSWQLFQVLPNCVV